LLLFAREHNGEIRRGFPADLVKVVRRKLAYLNEPAKRVVGVTGGEPDGHLHMGLETSALDFDDPVAQYRE
jgi:hypothetical protein